MTCHKANTSAQANFYTALKFGSKKHFYGRVVPEGILALHLEIDLFTAAERPKLFLVSKCTFTTPSRALSRIKIGLCTCIVIKPCAGGVTARGEKTNSLFVIFLEPTINY